MAPVVAKRLRQLAASFALILVVALALRVHYAWDYAQHRPQQALAIFPFLFEPGNVAASLAAGHGFSSPFRQDTGPTAWLTPVYPLILAGIFRIFGTYKLASFVAAAGLNIAFSTLTIVPLYFAGRRVGGIGIAALAAWLWAVFPNAIKLPVQAMWDASLGALLAAAILWATLAVAGSRRIASWCGYGLLWGLALMTTPALGALLPFLLGWMAWRGALRARRISRPALALGVAALCCVPWTIRNFETFHAFIPLRSVLGLTLWLGNHSQAAGVWPGKLHPIDNQVERARYVELGEVAYMHEKKQQALEFIEQHPAEEAAAAWSHFVAFWAGGSSHPAADFPRGDWSFRGILLFNLAAGAGALAGVIVLFRARNAYAFPLAAWPLIFPLVYYFTLGLARYRHPLDPALLLLTAVALKR